MTTRAKNNIHKPLTKMNLTVVISQPSDIKPHTVNQALTDPKWRQAMNDEFDALVWNGTWELFPSTSMQNLVGCKWVFRIKRLPDGSIDRYKARLVAKGHLSEDVYIAQPPGFVDRDNPTHVCKLKKTIYGLKQALRACVLLTQRHYISDLLAWTKMSGAKPVATPLVTDGNLTLHSDADWACNKDDYTSTSAYIVYLSHHPISWSSKKQRTVAQSSTDAKYRLVAATTSEINWICSLLTELDITLPTLPIIYCDNVGATYLCSNPVFHLRMKHVAINYHFIRDQVKSGTLRVTHVSPADQLVDALTKPLPQSHFQELQVKIGISSGAPS
ncbi:Retrovirus-related Pol polyprotein from transposon RE1 [Vitis vinifera]|uniref:Retrovirus-related Pol polyprotein from transposon RE1 n=1 Tax=Vitis vinifera TaxID=29760 RepID=A0A438G6K7_VITVI|nr:Retrovirus-related Pol polyprotein from transposon RE1 [Vitis vinifera]